MRPALAKTFVATLSARAGVLIVNLWQVRILVDRLGAEGYGAYTTAVAGTILFGFLDFGIGNVLQNQVAHLHAKNELGVRNASVSEAMGAMAMIALVGVAALLAIGLWVYLADRGLGPYSVEMTIALLVVLLSQLLALPFLTVAKVANGMQEVWLPQIWLAGAAVVFLAFTTLTPVSTVLTVVTGFAAINLLAAGACAGQCWVRYELGSPTLRCDVASLRRLIRQGSAFLWPQVAAGILFGFPTFFVSWNLPLIAVAQLGICQRLFGPLQQAQSLLLAPLWPAYTFAASAGNWSWVRKTYLRTLFISAAATGLAIAGILVCAPELLAWWIKNEPAAWPDGPLLGAYGAWVLVIAIAQPAAYLLNALGILRRQGIIGAASCGLTVMLLYATLAFFGANILWVPICMTLGYMAIALPGVLLEAGRALQRATVRI